MCVPEKAVIEEFGNDAIINGCQNFESNSVISRYCTCNTNNCNSLSITKQVKFLLINNL